MNKKIIFIGLINIVVSSFACDGTRYDACPVEPQYIVPEANVLANLFEEQGLSVLNRTGFPHKIARQEREPLAMLSILVQHALEISDKNEYSKVDAKTKEILTCIFKGHPKAIKEVNELLANPQMKPCLQYAHTTLLAQRRAKK